jgi:hypothetical protein
MAIIGAMGWFLLMSNAEKIRDSAYWFPAWIGSLVLLSMTFPAIAYLTSH